MALGFKVACFLVGLVGLSTSPAWGQPQAHTPGTAVAMATVSASWASNSEPPRAASAVRPSVATTQAAAWAAAVEQCRVTALVPPHCKKKRREGMAVAERLLAAAKALEENK